MKYYIAYGSNLNLEQMAYRCPGARLIRGATLRGWTLRFRGSMTGSYLTIERQRDGRVPVAIWQVTEEDERNLDRYEGYPRFYYKQDIRVGKLHCFAYIMHEDREIAPPSRGYVAVCLEGYRNMGFNPDAIWKAVEHSFKHMGERGRDLGVAVNG